LRLVRLAERPNRHADNDLVDSLGLTRVTGDSYSLIEMQRGSVAKNLAFIEYDLAIINADLDELPYGGGISRSLQILRTNKS
jgi:hypothetical protein